MIPAGIATGHESRFDFPSADRPAARPYLLASVPRTGSTFLSHALWQTGCLGAPLEYLNFDPAGPQGFASDNAVQQDVIWQRVLERRTTPNGVFGLKVFPVQFEALRHVNPGLVDRVVRTMLPGGGRTRVIELRRRDRTAHAISYARAILSGVWRKEQERDAAVAPAFDERAITHARQLIMRQEQMWTAMYCDLAIEPLVLWYEDAVADPQAAVDAVADYLGASLDPASRIEVPEVERQSQDGVAEWRARTEAQ